MRRVMATAMIARLACIALCLVAVVAAPGSAQLEGKEDELALRIPARITMGAADHLMGDQSPRADALYFVGDEFGTNEILVQSPIGAGPAPLFEALGDHAFPRVSPDGKRLAYISYVKDATGDACVRELRSMRERCLTGSDTADLEVFWIDTHHVGVLSRATLHSGFLLSRFSVHGGAGVPLLERDMIGLARSPDGAFLTYIDVERRREAVGVSFSSRVGQGLRIQRMSGERPVGDALVYRPALPGVTGFPSFSRDGRYLYFSQYLNDTNRDGTIDGSDNSVIVRVRFDGARENPVEGQRLEQLTTSRWNCHYPSPTDSALLMTCSHGGALDIYSLPLDGAVPSEFGPERLRGELAVARDLWAKLLLASRLAATVTDASERLDVLENVIWFHLEVREYESVFYYTDHIAELAGRDTARGRWARLFAALARHRRADLELTRGQLSRAYVQSERERLELVRALGLGVAPGQGPTPTDVEALSRIIASEIREDLGDVAGAVEDLNAIDVGALSDPHTLDLEGERVDRLYALLANRDAILASHARLSTHPALDTSDHLAHAQAFVEESSRGLGPSARAAALEAARRGAPDGSELALVLDVELALASLRDENQEEVRARIFALYSAEQDPVRRQAIALTTVRSASHRGNEFLQYQFATTWASSVPPGDPERPYAEELYRTVVLERAYGELADRRFSEAAGYFFQTSRTSEALDAHIGFIEARLARGQDDLRKFYHDRYRTKQDHPAYLFALAYLDARELPHMQDPARVTRTVRQVISLLRQVDAAWPRRIEVHHLWAYALHREVIVAGSRRQAGAAVSHYLVALDLARDRPRARASILLGVGLLQASLGNHRRAVDHFEHRARLPFVRHDAELAFDLARARSYYHARLRDEALDAAEHAQALLDANPQELGRYRAAVLDSRAFYHMNVGAFEAAAALYTQLWDALSGDDDTPINRLKASIGLAWASLYRRDYETALRALDRAREVVTANPTVHAEPHVSLVDHYVYGHERYVALLEGMRAEALAVARRYDEASRSEASRLEDFEHLFHESRSEDDLMAIAQTRLRQTQLARALGRTEDALRYAEAGLTRIDEFNRKTGSAVTETGVELLRAYAEMVLSGAAGAVSLTRDLDADLARAYEFMTRYPSSRWTADRARFELYLAMLRMRRGSAPAQPGIRE